MPNMSRIARGAVALSLAAQLGACAVLGNDFASSGEPGLPPLADGPIPPAFTAFVESQWPAAEARGVSRATFVAAFRGIGPDNDVLTKATIQPEFSRAIWDYLDDMAAESRIATGRDMLVRYRSLLDRIEATYGVNREIVVAIWGMESTYGAILRDPTKAKNVVRALATLGWRGGSRAVYGRQQLNAVLRILDHHDIDARHMIGSWAGAMGQTQFIPTTYLGYAVDFDGDGRRDIWTSVPDALASTANYLRKSGWQAGATWGYEVMLPPGFDASLEGRSASLADWSARGLTRATGGAFPRPGDQATLLLPAGPGGPAFLTLRNFQAIKRYNNATAYALGVGHLADRIAGAGPFVTPWPRGYTPLDEAGRTELQGRLRAIGFPLQKIDGKVGAETVAAIRAYEAQRGLAVTGNASLELLTLLRNG
jgi:membrane-bound lytic murein transglycosylase B